MLCIVTSSCKTVSFLNGMRIGGTGDYDHSAEDVRGVDDNGGHYNGGDDDGGLDDVGVDNDGGRDDGGWDNDGGCDDVEGDDDGRIEDVYDDNGEMMMEHMMMVEVFMMEVIMMFLWITFGDGNSLRKSYNIYSITCVYRVHIQILRKREEIADIRLYNRRIAITGNVTASVFLSPHKLELSFPFHTTVSDGTGKIHIFMSHEGPAISVSSSFQWRTSRARGRR